MSNERKPDSETWNFELEFCLKKEPYKKAYEEDGALWEKRHANEMKIFHELFSSEEGRARIAEDVFAINLIFFKRRRSFYNGFSKAEFSGEELAFLKDLIMRKRGKSARRGDKTPVLSL